MVPNQGVEVQAEEEAPRNLSVVQVTSLTDLHPPCQPHISSSLTPTHVENEIDQVSRNLAVASREDRDNSGVQQQASCNSRETQEDEHIRDNHELRLNDDDSPHEVQQQGGTEVLQDNGTFEIPVEEEAIREAEKTNELPAQSDSDSKQRLSPETARAEQLPHDSTEQITTSAQPGIVQADAEMQEINERSEHGVEDAQVAHIREGGCQHELSQGDVTVVRLGVIEAAIPGGELNSMEVAEVRPEETPRRTSRSLERIEGISEAAVEPEMSLPEEASDTQQTMSQTLQQEKPPPLQRASTILASVDMVKTMETERQVEADPLPHGVVADDIENIADSNRHEEASARHHSSGELQNNSLNVQVTSVDVPERQLHEQVGEQDHYVEVHPQDEGAGEQTIGGVREGDIIQQASDDAQVEAGDRMDPSPNTMLDDREIVENGCNQLSEERNVLLGVNVNPGESLVVEEDVREQFETASPTEVVALEGANFRPEKEVIEVSRESAKRLSPAVSPSSGAVRKKGMERYHASTSQLRRLVDEFNKNPTPSGDTLKYLSSTIQMPMHNLVLWFKNRRARHKKTHPHQPKKTGRRSYVKSGIYSKSSKRKQSSDSQKDNKEVEDAKPASSKSTGTTGLMLGIPPQTSRESQTGQDLPVLGVRNIVKVLSGGTKRQHSDRSPTESARKRPRFTNVIEIIGEENPCHAWDGNECYRRCISFYEKTLAGCSVEQLHAAQVVCREFFLNECQTGLTISSAMQTLEVGVDILDTIMDRLPADGPKLSSGSRVILREFLARMRSGDAASIQVPQVRQDFESDVIGNDREGEVQEERTEAEIEEAAVDATIEAVQVEYEANQQCDEEHAPRHVHEDEEGGESAGNVAEKSLKQVEPLEKQARNQKITQAIAPEENPAQEEINHVR